MALRLLPQTTSHPCGDAGLFVDILGEGRGFLFDLGHSIKISNRLIRRVEVVCISHTHLDHFVNITYFIRNSITRENPIKMIGPPNFIKNIQGLFNAFTWNISEEYPLELHVTEYDEKKIKEARFSAKNKFKMEYLGRRKAPEFLIEDKTITLKACILDHGTEVLAYRLDEKKHINVRKDKLKSLGFESGPWLNNLKKAIIEELPEDTRIETPKGIFKLKDLKEELILITEGHSIGYLVDFNYTEENVEKIIKNFKGVQLLYIEASFKKSEWKRAKTRKHLTSYQAGKIAKLLSVKKVVPIHLSPKFLGMENIIFEEVKKSFLK